MRPVHGSSTNFRLPTKFIRDCAQKDFVLYAQKNVLKAILVLMLTENRCLNRQKYLLIFMDHDKIDNSPLKLPPGCAIIITAAESVVPLCCP